MIGGNVLGNRVKLLIFKTPGGLSAGNGTSGGIAVAKTVKPLTCRALPGFAACGSTPPRAAAAVTCMLLIFMAFGVFAQPRPALFLGLMNDRGEAVQSEMEQAIRNAFAANQRIRLTDKLETQRIVREKERLGRGNVENFIPPGVKLDSSTVIIRGIVQEPEFKLGRHWLLWGRIDARIGVKFQFEEISGAANYQGDFSASANKRKELLFFASARKNVHVSAADREGLLGELQSKIVKEVSDFASTFFNALTADPPDAEEADAEGAATDTEADTADTITDTEAANQENEQSEPSDSSGVKAEGGNE